MLCLCLSNEKLPPKMHLVFSCKSENLLEKKYGKYHKLVI